MHKHQSAKPTSINTKHAGQPQSQNTQSQSAQTHESNRSLNHTVHIHEHNARTFDAYRFQQVRLNVHVSKHNNVPTSSHKVNHTNLRTQNLASPQHPEIQRGKAQQAQTKCRQELDQHKHNAHIFHVHGVKTHKRNGENSSTSYTSTDPAHMISCRAREEHEFDAKDIAGRQADHKHDAHEYSMQSKVCHKVNTHRIRVRTLKETLRQQSTTGQTKAVGKDSTSSSTCVRAYLLPKCFRLQVIRRRRRECFLGLYGVSSPA